MLRGDFLVYLTLICLKFYFNRIYLYIISTPFWVNVKPSRVEGFSPFKCHSMTEFKNMLVLEYCKKDLEKVEVLLKQYYSKNTHFGQVIKPYKTLLAQLSEEPPINIREVLKGLLVGE